MFMAEDLNALAEIKLVITTIFAAGIMPKSYKPETIDLGLSALRPNSIMVFLSMIMP